MVERLQELNFPDGCDRKAFLLVVHADFLQGNLVCRASFGCCEEHLTVSTLSYLGAFVVALLYAPASSKRVVGVSNVRQLYFPLCRTWSARCLTRRRCERGWLRWW